MFYSIISLFFLFTSVCAHKSQQFECSPYQTIYRSQHFRFQILVSMPSIIINHNIEQEFFIQYITWECHFKAVN